MARARSLTAKLTANHSLNSAWRASFWYQIAPFKNSRNADADIWVIMMVLTLGLILVPFIPGVRSVPRVLRVYRLIWRDYYRQEEHGG